MARGFLVGVIWGIIVVGAILAGLSLFGPTTAPRADAPAPTPAAVEQGTGQGVLAAPTPSDPAAAPEEPAPDPAPQAPLAQDGEVTSDAADTEVNLPAGSQFNQPPRDVAPTLPEGDDAPQAEAPAVPEGRVETAAPAPDTTPAETPVAAADAPVVQAPEEAATPVISETVDPPAPPAEFQPAPLGAILPTIGDEASEEISLPGRPVAQLVGEPEPADQDGDAAPETTAVVAPAPQPQGPALEVFAAAVDRDPSKPAFSIVLIDSEESRLDRASLLGFAFPVAFAIDPARADAAEAARIYRSAGYEVVMLADSLPRSGPPQDMAQAFEGALQNLPEAVAILDSRSGFLQRTRSALGPLLDEVSQSGHGMLFYDESLNQGVSEARRNDVPALTIYRALDADRERSTVITRYLDRATFVAGQEGAVVVVGRSLSDTVTALYAWQQSNRANAVQVVPVSQVLRERGLGEG